MMKATTITQAKEPIGLREWHCAAAFRNLSITVGDRTDAIALKQSETPGEVSGMWRPIKRGKSVGHFAIVKEQPFIGAQSQQLAFDSGDGEVGIENQGLNRSGMGFVAGGNYEGLLWARAKKPTTLFAAMENRDGTKTYAEQTLSVAPGPWQKLPILLTPSETDPAGRFSLNLKQPGSITIGHVFLQPGEWGRFKGLPVRRDVAEGMIQQGITVVRYGGSMVNHEAYRWKNMIGPRDRRPPTAGTWYHYSSNGWGIPEFMALCEAAGFEYIPAFNINESPQDMADFLDYAKAPAKSAWGAKRAADGHQSPFALQYMELGNEERVDEEYAGKFEALAAAIWSKDPTMILVVGDFAYDRPIKDPFHFTGAASRITTLAAQERILKFAKQHVGEVWFDIHVDTDHPVQTNRSLNGMFSFADAVDKLADGAKHKVVVFELNAGNHAQKRALANAMTISAIERDGRMSIVTSANGLQPDGQNDNGWDQGLLFLNSPKVWFQPPGYVTQMLSSNYVPSLVQCDVSTGGTNLQANAKRSEDGKTLVLEVVNPGETVVAARVRIGGFVPAKPLAVVSELAGSVETVNTADVSSAITSRRKEWKHELKDGITNYAFPSHSFTIIRFE